MCFLELKQLEYFVEVLNSIQRCVTPGCLGALVPSTLKSIGLSGAISITFSCLMHHIPNESMEVQPKLIAVAVQVAFLVAGCTHTTEL